MRSIITAIFALFWLPIFGGILAIQYAQIGPHSYTRPNMAANKFEQFNGSANAWQSTLPENVLSTAGADIPVNSHKLTGLLDPTSPQDAATAQYVNSQVATIGSVKVRASTTAVLSSAYTYLNGVAGVGATIAFTTLAACQTFDGVTVALLDRILIKDEATTNRPYNGIYSVTTLGVAATVACVLTRTTDADTAAELADILVQPTEGTANVGKVYDLQLAASAITVGTTNLVPWTQISGPGLAIACSQLPALTGDVTSSSGSCATSVAKLNGSICATGTIYYGQTASAPICSTTTWPNATVQGDIIVATAANGQGSVVDVAVGSALQSGGVGAVPTWTVPPQHPVVAVGIASATCAATDATVRYILPGQTASALITGAAPIAYVPFGVGHITKLTVAALANTLANSGTVTFTAFDATSSANKSTKLLNAASGTTPQTDTTSYSVSAGDVIQMKCTGSNTGSGGNVTYALQIEFGI